MSLKKSHGNMYPWVTHMHNHLAGECGHRCSYCYVGRNRFGRAEKYTGPPRFLEEELAVGYGAGRTIFIEHMNDLFCKEIPNIWILEILAHARKYPGNSYVFQTKNPERAIGWRAYFPDGSLIGTTIETNRPVECSQAPSPYSRKNGIAELRDRGRRVFVTIEPIMDFDVEILADWIAEIKPEFVNIGADSKGSSLAEPPAEKITALINLLTRAGIIIREKKNLERLLQGFQIGGKTC